MQQPTWPPALGEADSLPIVDIGVSQILAGHEVRGCLDIETVTKRVPATTLAIILSSLCIVSQTCRCGLRKGDLETQPSGGVADSDGNERRSLWVASINARLLEARRGLNDRGEDGCERRFCVSSLSCDWVAKGRGGCHDGSEKNGEGSLL